MLGDPFLPRDSEVLGAKKFLFQSLGSHIRNWALSVATVREPSATAAESGFAM
jgi:hypothetical protein